MKNVMIDLETLGTSCDSVILSLGAVAFDETIEDSFYRKINLQSCTDLGLKIDTDTVLWWLGQNELARKEIFEGNKDFPTLSCALLQFSAWLVDKENVKIWGNGSNFDNTILANAYRVCGLEIPWKFWNDRCYRTMKNIRKIELERTEVKHDALEDATYQARHLIKIMESIK